MKNEKEFFNILDECLERILTGGETVAQCLASYPEHAAELEPLLQTALGTKETLEISPRPEFRERARYQILAELRDIEERKQRRFSLFSWQPRWATAAIAVLVLLVASSGTVAAAGDSMPDQPLYPVKLATESVRLALTPSTLGKAEYYAELVDRRVQEIVSMADKGKLKHMEKATERMNNQLIAMAVLVGAEEGVPGGLTIPAALPEAAQAPAEAAREVPAAAVEPEEQRPEMMMAPPPPEDRGPQKGKPEITAAPAQPSPEKAPALAPMPAVVPGQEDKAEEEDEDGKMNRRARLMMIIAKNAEKHPEALQAALQRVPESARPALLRALETSNIEYEKLLELLEEEEDEEEDEDEEKDED